MSRRAAKLAFVHRRLWREDGIYRVAALLGPPPLLGCALAATLWMGAHVIAGGPAASRQLPWAQPHRVPTLASSGQPYVAIPAVKLPGAAADGTFPGFTSGWQGTIAPITVSSTLSVNVLLQHLATFTLDQPVIDMAPIMAAGPPTGLYVGVETAALAVKTAGVYALTVRFERSSPQSAECLKRLGFAGHRLVSDLSVNVNGAVFRTYDAVQFELRPGLYQIGVAFGCWRGQQMIGPGQVTVLIRHPGEQELRPAGPGEILRRLSGAQLQN